MKVSAITVPIFRPNAFSDSYLVRGCVGDQFSEAYLIVPEGVEREDAFSIDLDGRIPENLLHIVTGEDDRVHVEPYLPALDGKTPYSNNPFHVYVQVAGYKFLDNDYFRTGDVFLELWDDLPPGLERPGVRSTREFTVISRQSIRFVD